MASWARGSDDYVWVYGRVLEQVSEPVIPHWLGEVFDPKLAGYWGARGWREVLDSQLSLVRENRDRIDGVKVFLLGDRKEIAMRRRLPEGVRMCTGDDFNYLLPDLGRRRGFQPRPVRDLQSHSPGGCGGRRRPPAGGWGALQRYPCPDGPPLSRHIIRGPHLLQDGDRVPLPPKRLPGPLPDGGWPRDGPLDAALRRTL